LALASPLDFVGIQIAVTWSGRDATKSVGKTLVRFDLVMPPNFASVDEFDQNHMVVDIAAVARNRDGNVIAELSQRIDEHLKSDGLGQIQHNGMTYRDGLRLPPGEYTVRFVVRDAYVRPRSPQNSLPKNGNHFAIAPCAGILRWPPRSLIIALPLRSSSRQTVPASLPAAACSSRDPALHAI
jgi:hypothetical protein